MDDLKKIDEFLSKVKAIKNVPIPVTKKQAAAMMGCSTKTVQRYAKRYNVHLYEGIGGGYHYHLSGVHKMLLAREYRNFIRRFKKKSEAGYYEKRK